MKYDEDIEKLSTLVMNKATVFIRWLQKL